MKPEELMIGDWVKCGEPDCGGHRVDYINEMDDEVGVDGEILDLNMIAPIPLTPEILEKNGFEQFPSSKIISYSDSDSDVTLDYDSTKHMWYFSVCNDDVDIAIITISYVHELQHALRLCKIDKEIVL